VSRSGFAGADETETRVWNGIAARLFLSPRTVQARLSDVYTNLGLTSQVQLAQQAARKI
jgi:DNA-binding NarL/FixJ family response regulator